MASRQRQRRVTQLGAALLTVTALTLPAAPPSLDSSVIKPEQMAASVDKPPQR